MSIIIEDSRPYHVHFKHPHVHCPSISCLHARRHESTRSDRPADHENCHPAWLVRRRYYYRAPSLLPQTDDRGCVQDRGPWRENENTLVARGWDASLEEEQRT